jgi:hypothetical protein
VKVNTEKPVLTERGHKRNVSLANTFYSQDDVESRGSIIKVPVLNRTFLQGKKFFEPLQFRYKQVST